MLYFICENIRKQRYSAKHLSKFNEIKVSNAIVITFFNDDCFALIMYFREAMCYAVLFM